MSAAGRYRPRAHFYVEAFRFDGQPRDAWPRWLADREDVTVFYPDKPGQPAKRIVIEHTATGVQSGGSGCWIVRHYGGRLGVFGDEAFIAGYEPVEAAR